MIASPGRASLGGWGMTRPVRLSGGGWDSALVHSARCRACGRQVPALGSIAPWLYPYDRFQKREGNLMAASGPRMWAAEADQNLTNVICDAPAAL